MNGEEWFQDTFSDGFWDKVDEWRDEWVDALEELEHACEEYAKSSDEPVEAHLADLFDYFNWRLKGSDHYSSTGILFMTYYFERAGSDLLDDDGEPFDNLTGTRRCSPRSRRVSTMRPSLTKSTSNRLRTMKASTTWTRYHRSGVQGARWGDR